MPATTFENLSATTEFTLASPQPIACQSGNLSSDNVQPTVPSDNVTWTGVRCQGQAAGPVSALMRPLAPHPTDAGQTPFVSAGPTQPKLPTIYPVLTRGSLKDWSRTPDVTVSEHKERQAVARQIFEAASTKYQGVKTTRLKVRGDLELKNYLTITQLPEGLMVGGNFTCINCPKLTHLPEHLSVGLDLTCYGCSDCDRVEIDTHWRSC
ncbi:MAG: hypothetical protein EOO38_05580 [Cytophagaceae bacterium]|nr:MAG: hypothetical protein EOO38_05580 [Cytophagaceae bacterium]